MGLTFDMTNLNKTWIFDLDGTIVVHNGYKELGKDILLDGAKEFIDQLDKNDYVIFLTSRKEEYRDRTIEFLNENKIRYNKIIFGVPFGERIIMNDRKTSGVDMAYCINVDRNRFPSIRITEEL